MLKLCVGGVGEHEEEGEGGSGMFSATSLNTSNKFDRPVYTVHVFNFYIHFVTLSTLVEIDPH